MKLVPEQFEKFNPVVLLLGIGFSVAGGYPLLTMRGPLILWLLRAVFGACFAIGVALVIAQLRSWRRSN